LEALGRWEEYYILAYGSRGWVCTLESLGNVAVILNGFYKESRVIIDNAGIK